MTRAFIATTFFLATVIPAWAGSIPVTPGPEVGGGIIAMGLLGVTVAWLRQRRKR